MLSGSCWDNKQILVVCEEPGGLLAPITAAVISVQLPEATALQTDRGSSYCRRGKLQGLLSACALSLGH